MGPISKENCVEGSNSTTVEIQTDGKVEVFTLDDLVDGEERTIEAGEHLITVRRSGDQIEVLMDGEDLESGIQGEDKKIIKMIVLDEEHEFGDHPKILTGGGKVHPHIWHSKDGENIKIIKIGDGEELKFIGEHGDADFETMILELEEELAEGDMAKIDVMVEHLTGDHGVFFLDDEEEAGNMRILKIGGPDAGMVHYRCKETGSVLLVKEEHATEETFVDPATGGVMNKVVDSPNRVIIKKTIEIIDED
ncbi:MAG: hypothetical protein K8R59_08130 [Thermoanaerobaculales bacterium]|nr:hypothetical protein [Thermoanaerobaculales bacterium]